MKTKLVEISYFEGKIKYYKVEINRTIKYVLDKYNYSINNKWIYKEFELHTDLNIQFNYDDLIIISDHEITKEDVVWIKIKVYDGEKISFLLEKNKTYKYLFDKYKIPVENKTIRVFNESTGVYKVLTDWNIIIEGSYCYMDMFEPALPDGTKFAKIKILSFDLQCECEIKYCLFNTKLTVKEALDRFNLSKKNWISLNGQRHSNEYFLKQKLEPPDEIYVGDKDCYPRIFWPDFDGNISSR